MKFVAKLRQVGGECVIVLTEGHLEQLNAKPGDWLEGTIKKHKPAAGREEGE